MEQELQLILAKRVQEFYKYLDPVGAREWRELLKQPELGRLVCSGPLNDLMDVWTTV